MVVSIYAPTAVHDSVGRTDGSQFDLTAVQIPNGTSLKLSMDGLV